MMQYTVIVQKIEKTSLNHIHLPPKMALPWPPSWILVLNNSESSCRCLPSSLGQSDLQFGRRCSLKNFKIAVNFDIETE